MFIQHECSKSESQSLKVYGKGISFVVVPQQEQTFPFLSKRKESITKTVTETIFLTNLRENQPRTEYVMSHENILPQRTKKCVVLQLL